jgi:ankyrin repeat protein
MQFTPLTAACGKGHLAIVKLLLKAGADVDKENTKYFWYDDDYDDSNKVRGLKHTATYL